MNIALIAGLGNPGAKYEHTRHNLGCDVLFKLADAHRIALEPQSKFQGLVGRGTIGTVEVRLAFPTTFMNESGRCIGALCAFYRISAQQILVVHDELDLNPGFMKLKQGGGLAGHNGLKSISAALGKSQDFCRLRMGIGKASFKGDVINYVLGKPAPDERQMIEECSDAAVRGIEILLEQGFAKASNFINGFKPQTA